MPGHRLVPVCVVVLEVGASLSAWAGPADPVIPDVPHGSLSGSAYTATRRQRLDVPGTGATGCTAERWLYTPSKLGGTSYVVDLVRNPATASVWLIGSPLPSREGSTEFSDPADRLSVFRLAGGMAIVVRITRRVEPGGGMTLVHMRTHEVYRVSGDVPVRIGTFADFVHPVDVDEVRRSEVAFAVSASGRLLVTTTTEQLKGFGPSAWTVDWVERTVQVDEGDGTRFHPHWTRSEEGYFVGTTRFVDIASGTLYLEGGRPGRYVRDRAVEVLAEEDTGRWRVRDPRNHSIAWVEPWSLSCVGQVRPALVEAHVVARYGEAFTVDPGVQGLLASRLSRSVTGEDALVLLSRMLRDGMEDRAMHAIVALLVSDRVSARVRQAALDAASRQFITCVASREMRVMDLSDPAEQGPQLGTIAAGEICYVVSMFGQPFGDSGDMQHVVTARPSGNIAGAVLALECVSPKPARATAPSR